MSKTLPAPLLADYAQKVTTFATGMRVTRRDGQVYGFTSHDKTVEIGGVTYSRSPGLVASSVEVAANLTVGNLELSTLNDGAVFSTADIAGDVWTNATYLIFRYNYNEPSHGIDPLLAGNFGELTLQQNMITVELRDIRQFLQQPIGDISSKTCRARLGDERCTKNISDPPYTLPFTVSAVTNKQNFRANALASPDDWFAEGYIEWTTGASVGQLRKVKSYISGGYFELALPMFSTINVGNQGIAVVGCRKRLEEDCRDKFDNVLNFVGEPHRRGMNDLTSAPDTVVPESSGGGFS